MADLSSVANAILAIERNLAACCEDADVVGGLRRRQVEGSGQVGHRERLAGAVDALPQCRSDRVVQSTDKRSGTWQVHTGNPFDLNRN